MMFQSISELDLHYTSLLKTSIIGIAECYSVGLSCLMFSLFSKGRLYDVML